MKIKLLKAYQLFQVGDIVDFGRGVNELLIERKRAEPYEEKKRGRPPLKREDQQTELNGISDIH